MNNQPEFDITLQRCSQNVESIGRTKTPTPNKRKDFTGNDKTSTKKPDEKSNIGKLASTEQALSLLRNSDLPDSERLISSPKVCNEPPNQIIFTGRKNCTQTFTESELSATKDNQCVFAKQEPPHSTLSNRDNLHLETKFASHNFFWKDGEVPLKSGHYSVQSEDLQKPSNIYGTVENRPFNIVGSWTAQTQPSENMQTGRDAEPPCDLRRASEDRLILSHKDEIDMSTVLAKSKYGHAKNSEAGKQKGNSDTGTPWHFQASAGTLFQVRASHLVKLMGVLLLAVAVFSFVFHSRIRALEEEKKDILNELGTVKMHLQLLVEKMGDVVALSVPRRSQRKHFSLYEAEQDFLNSPQHKSINEVQEIADINSRKISSTNVVKKVVKRSASTSRTTKGLLYPSNSAGVNALNNETSTLFGGSELDDWTVSDVNRQKMSKGNGKFKKLPRNKVIRRLIRKELKNLRDSHRAQIKGLKQSLELMQQQLLSANLSHCNDTSQMYLSSANSALMNSRAVYLQIDGSSVNIKKPRQLIGPWYLPNSGSDIGFNDLWYNHLSLNSNGTSIVFHENGLYLISAQVFYQLQHLHNSKPTPMGYRIHLKKNTKENPTFRRPLTIAECVPSFPSTIYQTCFTQVAWYIEAHDEVFLEHFTDSLPMIEALRSGQTFLGLVRLN